MQSTIYQEIPMRHGRVLTLPGGAVDNLVTGEKHRNVGATLRT